MAAKTKYRRAEKRNVSSNRTPFRREYGHLCQLRPTVERLEYRLPLTLGYSTYLGGSQNEVASDIATDSLGNTYVLGTTRSPSLGGVESPDSRTNRVFLTKFKPDGQIDSDFQASIGPTPQFDENGFAESIGWQVVIGPDSLPVVLFETFETDTLALEAGGFLPISGPARQLHIQKIDNTGKPVFETVLPVLDDKPGRSEVYAFRDVKLVIDEAGGMYAAYTAIQYTFGQVVVYDALLSSLRPEGVLRTTERLDASVTAMAVQRDMATGKGNLYIAQEVFTEDGTTDVLVSQYDHNFDLIHSASIGGDRYERANAIAVDPSTPGRVYVVGQTDSSDLALKNPFQTLPDRGEPSSGYTVNGFLMLLQLTNEGADQLIASTYFGGSRYDTLSDVALDHSGSVYVVGTTNSTNLPTVNALQPLNETSFTPRFGGLQYSTDLIVAKFGDNLSTPLFSTYFGGSGSDYDASLAIDFNGRISVAATSLGRSRSRLGDTLIDTDDFPTKAAAQPLFGGEDTDSVVFAINQQATLVGRGARATLGREFTDVVAEFNSPRFIDPEQLDVEINWGDGSESSGFVTESGASGNRYLVHGTHQYAKPGAYAVSVSVNDKGSGERQVVNAINVSQSSKSQLSGSIAVDPTRPNRLFAAMSEYKVDIGIRIATSEDAGVSWSPRLIAVANDQVLPPARGNPDALFDDFGNLFLAYSGAEDNIVIAWSIDGGRTFKKENHVNIRFTGGGSPGSPKLAFGAARNEVWVTYETSSVRATGAVVSGLGQVGVFDELTVTGSAGGRHSDIEVGPNGEVSVVWQTRLSDGQPVRLMSSVDNDGLGESSFTLPSTIDVSATDGALLTPAQESAVPLGAKLAWDTSDGPHRGRLYATYVDLVEGLPNPPGTPELTLFVTYSDDLGVNWSTASRVNFGPNFQSMFQPSIAIDSTTGVVAVAWYGTAGSDPAELSTSVGFFVATSVDGRQFSSAQRMNINPSDVITPDSNALDAATYSAPGLAFHNGRLYPLWSDNSDLEGSNYSAPQFETATRVVGIIDVHEAPPAIQPLPIEVIIGQSFTLPVATFSMQDASVNANQFTARISWGDQVSGGSSDGTITQPGGSGTPFVITGTHTYMQPGAFPIAVTVTDKRTGVASKSVSNVSAKQGSQAQPTIAVDPTNPKRLFAAWSDRGDLEKGIPVATSDDGGVTWKQRLIANGKDGLFLASQGGHAVFDQFGNLFLTYVTRAPNFSTVVLSSKDGGKVFTLLRRFETPKSVEPSIAVGPGEGGQGGSVWVTWSHGPAEALTVTVAGAQVDGLDRFQSFNQRDIAPTVADGVFRIYGDIAVGANGQVLVTYSKGLSGGTPAGPAEIVVQLDPDGLGIQPFGPPVRVTTTNVGPQTEIPPQAINGIDARGGLPGIAATAATKGEST